jgi:hypothetical protein
VTPINRRKNISKALDMERFQNRNLTSTTATFWVMKMTRMPARIKIKINFSFIF